MPNMMTTHSCQFLKPVAGTVPKTVSPDVTLYCTFSQVSGASLQWAKFSGVFYEFKLCVVLADSKRSEINEDWRVRIDGQDYTIKTINHKPNNFGYDYSVFGLSTKR